MRSKSCFTGKGSAVFAQSDYEIPGTAHMFSDRLTVMVARIQLLVRELERSQTLNKDTVVSTLRSIEKIGRDSTYDLQRLRVSAGKQKD
jgi:hypothetical protein